MSRPSADTQPTPPSPTTAPENSVSTSCPASRARVDGDISTALEGFTEAFTREMPPEWNIKGVIIEPGGFKTNWGGSGMVHAPRHPAYDANSPSAKFAQMRTHAPSIGDVHKAALAMIRIAGEPDPPLRLQLGTDAWGIATIKAKKTLSDAEKWAELSHGTNLDGYGMEILDYLKQALE